MTGARMRAGDADRQAAVERLTEHLTAGRLDLTEFDNRVAKAYAVTYLDELPELFHDLPQLPGPDPQGRRGFATSTPWVPPAGGMSDGSFGDGMWGPAGRNRPMPPPGHPGYPAGAGSIAGRALRVVILVGITLALLGLLFESRGFFVIPLIFIAMAIFRGGRRGRWARPGRPPWR